MQLLERLAAEHRLTERVCLVSSDATLRGTAGHEVEQRSSAGFLADFERPQHEERASSRVGDRVDEETRAALERLRRGEKVLGPCIFANALVTPGGPCYLSAST